MPLVLQPSDEIVFRVTGRRRLIRRREIDGVEDADCHIPGSRESDALSISIPITSEPDPLP